MKFHLMYYLHISLYHLVYQQKLFFVSWAFCASDGCDAPEVNRNSRDNVGRACCPDTISTVTLPPCAILRSIPWIRDVRTQLNANPSHPDALWFYALSSWTILIQDSRVPRSSLLDVSHYNPAYINYYLRIVTSSHHISLIIAGVL